MKKMAINSTFLPNSIQGINNVTSGGYVIPNTVSPQYTISSTKNAPGTVTCKDLVMDGVSVKETLEKISDRLTILIPDPEKLEKYAALKEAYDHYKLMEALLNESEGS